MNTAVAGSAEDGTDAQSDRSWPGEHPQRSDVGLNRHQRGSYEEKGDTESSHCRFVNRTPVRTRGRIVAVPDGRAHFASGKSRAATPRVSGLGS